MPSVTPSSAPPSRPLRPHRLWFASGLLLAGTAVLLWAAVTASGTPAGHLAVAYPPLFAAMVVAVLLAVALWRGPRDTEGAGPSWPLLGPGTALSLFVVLPVVVALTANATVEWTEREFSQPFAPPLLPLALVGGALVLLAVAVLSWPRGPVGHGGRLSRFAAGFAGAGAGAVAVTTTLVYLVVLPVDATTATAPGDLPPPPEDVTGVGWRWEAPGGGGVVQVVAAGDGAVARTQDGVYALDTLTGEERWRYRREGELITSFAASPDGTALFAGFQTRDHSGEPTLRAVTFDARTGRVRSEHFPRHSYVPWGTTSPNAQMTPLLSLTADTYLLPRSVPDSYMSGPEHDLHDQELIAFDLDTGEEAWRFTEPDDCLTQDQEHQRALADVALVVMHCVPGIKEWNIRSFRDKHDADELEIDHDVVLLGLDPRTGAQVWRHEEPASADPRTVRVTFAPDGGALVVDRLVDDDRHSNLALRAGDGAELASAEPLLSRMDSNMRSGRRPHGSVDADGYTTWDSAPEEGRSVYGWEPFEGEGRQVGRSAPDRELFVPDLLVLGERLFLTSGVRGRDEGSGNAGGDGADAEAGGEYLKAVSVLPWEDAEDQEGREFDVPYQLAEEPALSMLAHQTTHPVHLVPGAVVLAPVTATEVIGLQ